MLKLAALFFFMYLISCKHTIPKKGEVHVLHSAIIKDNFTLQFRKSDGFNSKKPFTLIYITDASLGLGQYALGIHSAWKAKLPENSVLVAIGHTDDPRKKKRARDFVPSDAGGYKDENFGNADRFYSFLKSDIIPFVKEQFPGATKSVFIGHSFGGLFCLYTVLKNERLFDGYFAISPSVWANRHELMKLEEEFAKNNDALQATIRIYAGSLEFFNKVLYSSRRFYNTIQSRKFKNLCISFEVVRGANHFSIRKPAIDKIFASLTR